MHRFFFFFSPPNNDASFSPLMFVLFQFVLQIQWQRMGFPHIVVTMGTIIQVVIIDLKEWILTCILFILLDFGFHLLSLPFQLCWIGFLTISSKNELVFTKGSQSILWQSK
jgi:hypothetical protein